MWQETNELKINLFNNISRYKIFFCQSNQIGKNQIHLSTKFELLLVKVSVKKQHNIYFCSLSFSFVSEINYRRFYLELIIKLSGDIETNPGPQNTISVHELNILSFNINGALNKAPKQKRLLNKLHKIKNILACFQETHLVEKDEFCLKARWSHEFVTANFTNASAGTAILYRKNDWDKVNGFDTLIEGRLCYLAVEKGNFKLVLFNIYAPNNPSDSETFYKNLKKSIDQTMLTYPEHEMCLCGDFNLGLSIKDNINRVENRAFDNSVKIISDIISDNSLLDVRIHNSEDCMPSWKRLKTASKLDFIFASAQLFNYVSDYVHVWSFEQSDHCALMTKCKIPAEIIIGRGYFKINMQLCENPDFLKEITDHISQINLNICNSWNPHQVWEYYKLEIRNIFMKCGAYNSSNHKRDLESSENELNNLIKLHNNKLKNESSTRISFDILDESIMQLETKLNSLRKIEAERLLFRSKVKYINEGEKCTKYFLNTLKRKERRVYIPSIKIDDITHRGNDMGLEILKFYRKLYDKDNCINNSNKEYLSVLNTKLTNEQRDQLDSPITIEELHNILLTCKDSAPGLDGIPYSLYKRFWNILGYKLLDSWNYSVQIGELSSDQRHSVISLLQKP